MAKLFLYFISRDARFYRNFFWIWLFLVLFVSSIPSLKEPDLIIQGNKIRLDHIFHWFQYMNLIFLLVSWQIKKQPSHYRKILFIILFLGIVIGVGDEYHQLLIPGRSFTYPDMLSNIVGVLTGIVLSAWMWRSYKNTILSPPEK